MAFEVASTNLVIELGLILALTMGWQFTLAEFIGGPIMIIMVALGFRLWMRGKIVDAAREQAELGRAGSMEGTRRWTCRWAVTAPSGNGCSPEAGSYRSLSTS